MLRSGIIYDKFYKQIKKFKKTKFLLSEIKDIVSKGTHTEVITSSGSFKSKCVFSSLFDLKPLLNQKKYPVLKQHFWDGLLKQKNPFSILKKLFSWILISLKKMKLVLFICFHKIVMKL